MTKTISLDYREPNDSRYVTVYENGSDELIIRHKLTGATIRVTPHEDGSMTVTSHSNMHPSCPGGLQGFRVVAG